MIKIIITGHGNFASGLLSAYGLLAGDTEKGVAIDFLESYSTEQLTDLIEEEINQDAGDVLILTDLQGGSPYNCSVLLGQTHKNDRQIEVISGTNFPMVLSSLLSQREDMEELLQEVLKAGTEGIQRFQSKKKKIEEVEDDGI